jgi:PmbA protein
MKAQMQIILDKLLATGADKASVRLVNTHSEEFNIIYKRLSFMRTVESSRLTLFVIKDQRSATISVNQLEDAEIDKAITTMFTNMESGVPDPAMDISPAQEAQTWESGDKLPNSQTAIIRMNELIADMRQKFPQVEYDATLTHNSHYSCYLNSNGADFVDNQAYYSFSITFTSKQDNRCSSMNYSFIALRNSDVRLLEQANIEELIRQNTEQVITRPIPESFIGDVIFYPLQVCRTVDGFLESQIGSFPFLSNSCKFPDHIGKQVLDSKLTLKNAPDYKGFAVAARITDDGFASQNATVIENGVLRHYPINLYTANKCNMKRTLGDPSSYLIEAGDTALADMIKSVEKGVLLVRQSGDSANSDGDISFVAKNSYYIEDGKIQYPISETMIAGNIVNWLQNIRAISRETLNNGYWQCPYFLIPEVNISRK